MVAYSLLRAGSLTDNTWRALIGRFQAQWRQSREAKRERQKDGAGPNYYIVRRHRLGSALLHFVSRNMSDGALTAGLVACVINDGYAPDLTDDEVVQIGRDPFLIAYALALPADRCVVTTEVSAPRKQRQNRRIPDVCTTMGIVCCNTFAMTKALGFKTGWTP